MMGIKVTIQRVIQIIFGRFGVNPFARSYEEIPLATRFFRNKPLIETIFGLIEQTNLRNPSFFFHACSTGEEPYSYAMFNIEHTRIPLIIRASDYNQRALNSAHAAVYDEKTIESSNFEYIEKEYKKYFFKVSSGYSLDQSVRSSVNDFIFFDYTLIDSEWVARHRADIVFCNSTLLYHSHRVQEYVLEHLCIQAVEILVLSGIENRILERVLKKNGFIPYKVNWEAIYDGCALRRVKNDPIYRTPTTPYLSDKNKIKDHYFRYSIFCRSNGQVLHSLDANGKQ